jgi:hypothetical protein
MNGQNLGLGSSTRSSSAEHIPRVEVYVRTTDTSWRYATYSAGDTFPLEAFGITLTVDELYLDPSA